MQEAGKDVQHYGVSNVDNLMYSARGIYKQTVCQHATVLPLWNEVRQGTCWISETNVIIKYLDRFSLS